jgi:hypothetical protein
VSRADQVLLRRLVLEHKAGERRHRFPAALHVGRPGRPELGCFVESPGVPSEALDLALRCELLAAVLHRRAEGPVMTWLTRPGRLEVQDLDLEWLRAVTAVREEMGRPLPYVVVTRAGWRDPRSGAGRTWRRLRQR